jgi:hypothetical protein
MQEWEVEWADMEAMALYLEAVALHQEVQASRIREETHRMTLQEARRVEGGFRKVEVGMLIQTPIHRSERWQRQRTVA